jgi:hypothetical protein
MQFKRQNSKGKGLVVFFQKNFYLLPVFLIFNFLLLASPVYAQSLDLTNIYDIGDKDAKDGDILIFEPEKEITRTDLPYDIRLFGVLQNSPTLVLQRKDETGKAVARSGIAEVNVTNVNGPINPGDHITTSQIKGYGMKATQSGYSLGVAVKAFDESSAESIDFNGQSVKAGKIQVAVQIEFAELTNPRSTLRIFEFIGTAFFRKAQDPQGLGQIIKYISAGIIIILSLAFGMIILSRSMPKAIEAMGRNPLARRSIQLTIILNIILMVFVTGIGIIAALVILKL